jgi:hypothetical protein
VIVGGIDGELIGRLSATAEAVADGTCGATLVVLVGRSGVGKTTIVQRFHQDLVDFSAGAAHWDPIRVDGAPWLESRRWVHPHPDGAPDGRPDGDRPTHLGGDRVADRSATGHERPGPPWLWLGLECGPDATGASDVLGVTRARLRHLLATHARAAAMSVGHASFGGDPTSDAGDPRDGGQAAGGGRQVDGGQLAVAETADVLAELPPEEVDRRFVELARRHPTVVAVDDLHLADAETTAWLRNLLGSAPLLMVGTAWPQAIDRGPLEVMADPLAGVHVELVEVDLLDPPALELLLKQIAADLDGRDVTALLERCGRSPLELQVLLDNLRVRDAREMGLPIDRTMIELLPGGSHDELEPMWRSLPPKVQEALGMAADVGADWLALCIGSITQSAAEAVLAEIAGDRPAQTWVAELDEQLAVWVDPVLQAVVAHRRRPVLALDDLLELHRWVVASALDMAQRWVPNDRAAVGERRAALGAEGFLPTAATTSSLDVPADVTEVSAADEDVPAAIGELPAAVEDVPATGAPAAGVPTAAASPGVGVVPAPIADPGRVAISAVSTDRGAQVEGLVQALRTGDPARLERLAAEMDSLLEVCRREDGPMAATTMRLEIARSAVSRRRADATRALERLRPLMALALDVHGSDGMPVLEGRWNGVLLLRRVRRRGDAIREADCLVRTLVRTHGAGHPDTVAARALLAETLGAAGLHAESLQLFAQLAADVARRSGPGSDEALATYIGWADALYLAGRRADAVTLMRQADDAASVSLSADHPVRRRARRHLARLEEGRAGRDRRAERQFGRSAPPGP